MKKVLFVILAGFIISCQSGDGHGDLTFDADVEGVDDGTPVYLSKMAKGGQTVPVDTGKVQNGELVVDLPKADFQELYFLRIKDIQDNLYFINENEPLEATLYKDSLQKSEVKGGESNKAFSKYTAQLAKMNKKSMEMSEEYNQRQQNDPEVQQEMMDRQQELQEKNIDFGKEIIENNPNSLTAVFILSDMLQYKTVPHPEMKKMFDGLSDDVQETFMGEQVKTQLKQSENLAVGTTAPDFSAKTPDGEEISLEEALDEGEYTLVDFWASWCQPCRVENPNYVQIYEDYHDKGFNILGVSLDRDGAKDKWEEAIEDDGVGRWDNISNLKFWDDPIAKKYNIRAIPANFLMDEDGKIVAKDLRGDALRKKVKELVGDED